MPPLNATAAIKAPATRSGQDDPSQSTSTPATTTPPFEMKSLKLKVSAAFMFTSSERRRRSSTRHHRLIAPATSASPIMTGPSGSAPYIHRRTTSASTMPAKINSRIPDTVAAPRFQAGRRSRAR